MIRSPSLILVYFAFVDSRSDWRRIIRGQLRDLAGFGLLEAAEVHVHVSDVRHPAISEAFVRSLCPRARISSSARNEFEYPGIRRVHELARAHPSALVMYFHTKGMSYGIRRRARVEMALLRRTFRPWQEVTELLRTNPALNKAGLIPAQRGGHVWFNFWYAKAAYLATLEPPVATGDRYYFEWWLGKTTDSHTPSEDTYSIDARTHLGVACEEEAAVRWVERLMWQEFPVYYFFYRPFARVRRRLRLLRGVPP